MTDHAPGPPYRAAFAVFGGVLALYVFTLAPSVTLWDAGEFIAAAKTMGIPHPPGTPMFVLLNNVWAKLIPIGTFAWRTNLMSAVFSAAGAALWFLILYRALISRSRELAWGGAITGAVLSATAFTVWQNSNETEAYMVATFTIAAAAWLSLRWRDTRGTARAAHALLLIVYLQAVSIGNHLLALLVGPAIIGFLFYVMRSMPASTAERRVEWAQWGVVVAGWLLMVTMGLGNLRLLPVTGVVFVAAGAYAFTRRAGLFAVVSLLAIAIGISTYAILYIRAGWQPMINEADPSTLDALLSVMAREQYPPRTPFDNPMFPSGVGNPGRSIDLVLLQLLNYVQYFDWQWSRTLSFTTPVLAKMRLPATLLFTTFGIYGLAAIHRHARSVFWLLLVLWLTTGFGLVAYMNFKPGYSIAWDQYQQMRLHEVRERDYFFVVSFLCWGLFAGVGLASIVEHLRRQSTLPYVYGLYALAAVPLILNFTAASRRHGPDATLARDFAYDLLQSVEPYGILFTYGDNDTFPLWYLQEVEAIRQDVVVVNLSLANTEWYNRQLRDNPVRPFNPSTAPERYAALVPAQPPGPIHNLTDAQLSGLIYQQITEPLDFVAGPIVHRFPANTSFMVKDQLLLFLIRENWQQRPIAWGVTTGQDQWLGMNRHVVQQGLAFRLVTDSLRNTMELTMGVGGAPLDYPVSVWLVDTVYRYAGLFDTDDLALEPTAAGIARNLGLAYLSLASAYDEQTMRAELIRALRRANHLAPNAQIEAYLRVLEQGEGDSTPTP